ncbi:hypothetical protein HFP57_11135 [Parasphingopyxis algicola]|uniref:hypothetical protein n=1 Tax=Parasphingopyxis algicola TaxID=2026624 RepID=UPI00159FAAC9|nr:hypothetical protein [Parasphingopyxis algicola]QLC25517.1 hypothetical protein HFP57_11135 [Parasphingopyxis algicola]
MRHGKAIFGGAVALALAGCGGLTEQAAGLTADEVIARHVEAIGGAEAVQALENIRIRPEVVEPDFTVLGDYRATREGRMRVDVYAGGERVFSEGIDGDGGWQQAGAGAEFTETTPIARQALAHGVEFNLFGLHDLAVRGHRASLFGREEIDGVDYYVIHVAMEDGFERYFFINPGTWLIERYREVSALHPDIDAEARPAETIQGNFQESCGVLRATETRKVDRETGQEIQRTRTLSVECNVDPDSLNIGRNEPAMPPA